MPELTVDIRELCLVIVIKRGMADSEVYIISVGVMLFGNYC